MTAVEIPLEASAGEMYVLVQDILTEGGEQLTDEQTTYVLDTAKILDSLELLREIDGATRRDVVGVLTVIDSGRGSAPLHDALYWAALRELSDPVRREDGTTADGKTLAACLRAIASLIESIIVEASLPR
jgi:hypothetical protein